jgi:hypothetical protein
MDETRKTYLHAVTGSKAAKVRIGLFLITTKDE